MLLRINVIGRRKHLDRRLPIKFLFPKCLGFVICITEFKTRPVFLAVSIGSRAPIPHCHLRAQRQCLLALFTDTALCLGRGGGGPVQLELETEFDVGDGECPYPRVEPGAVGACLASVVDVVGVRRLV